MKLSFIFWGLGVHLWLVGCGEKPRDEKKMTLNVPPTVPTLSINAILQPDEWSKPETSINLPTERLETELKYSLQNIHALKSIEKPDYDCFFKGLIWKGTDVEMRAEGESRPESCVVKTAEGKTLTYRNNKVELSVFVRCEKGGLRNTILPNSPVLKFDPGKPFCSSGSAAVFYQSRLTGEIEYPLASESITIAYKATSARMMRDGSPCLSLRENGHVRVNNDCMDINLLKSEYAGKTNWMFRSFTYKDISGDVTSSRLNAGRFETELNNWVGRVTLTEMGADYELKKGEDVQKGHLE